MNKAAITIAGACVFATCTQAGEPLGDGDQYWPRWRGPAATGVAPNGNPPLEWSESKNVRWKAEIPGFGAATPIVWGERVYVQTAVETDKKGESANSPESQQQRRPGRRGRPGRMNRPPPTNIHRFSVLALDRRTGKTVWERTVCEALPHEPGHPTSSYASGSPVTDGEHIFAYFGSRGLYCLDLHGTVVWQKDLGDMRTRNGFGEGSSPALHGDTIVITWDHEGDDFIVALDKKTGQELWRAGRDEPTSWATPLIVEHDGKPQVITSATRLIRSYDLKTGELLWRCGGMTSNVIPTPVPGNGLVYAISGYRGSALQAIRYAGARGDVTDSPAVVWKYDGRGTPYVPSPLLYGDKLYFLDTNRAILSCVNARTGEKHYDKKRLEGLQGVYASLVGARGRVYVAGREGKTAVIRHGPEFKLLATNALDDGFDASPAIVDKEIFLRGREYLYCIAED